MKCCSRCKISKPLTDYYKSSKMKDGLQTSCKEGMAESYQRSRKAKLQHYRDVQDLRVQQNVDRFREWKAKQKCACCPESDPCCLDLHHLDPAEKEAAVSDVMRFWSWERLTEEIDKCIVVCRNCHAKIHAGKIVLDVA